MQTDWEKYPTYASIINTGSRTRERTKHSETFSDQLENDLRSPPWDNLEGGLRLIDKETMKKSTHSRNSSFNIYINHVKNTSSIYSLKEDIDDTASSRPGQPTNNSNSYQDDLTDNIKASGGKSPNITLGSQNLNQLKKATIHLKSVENKDQEVNTNNESIIESKNEESNTVITDNIELSKSPSITQSPSPLSRLRGPFYCRANFSGNNLSVYQNSKVNKAIDLVALPGLLTKLNENLAHLSIGLDKVDFCHNIIEICDSGKYDNHSTYGEQLKIVWSMLKIVIQPLWHIDSQDRKSLDWRWGKLSSLSDMAENLISHFYKIGDLQICAFIIAIFRDRIADLERSKINDEEGKDAVRKNITKQDRNSVVLVIKSLKEPKDETYTPTSIQIKQGRQRTIANASLAPRTYQRFRRPLKYPQTLRKNLMGPNNFGIPGVSNQPDNLKINPDINQNNLFRTPPCHKSTKSIGHLHSSLGRSYRMDSDRVRTVSENNHGYNVNVKYGSSNSRCTKENPDSAQQYSNTVHHHPKSDQLSRAGSINTVVISAYLIFYFI